MSTEYGWVIEHMDSEPCAPRYWSGPDNWSDDHMKAVRFARKEDAERVESQLPEVSLERGHRVCEHEWG